MSKSKFTATKTNFDGEPGYMVEQIRNERTVASQFVSEKVYEKFCKLTGIAPEIIN